VGAAQLILDTLERHQSFRSHHSHEAFPKPARSSLTNRYFPSILEKDRLIFPSIDEIVQQFKFAEVSAVPIPHDCIDGFLGAYWQRPHFYLDPERRSAISAFAGLRGLDEGIALLKADLQDGTWSSMFGHILSRPTLDVGYRLILGHRR
jgi:hypothetical protein